MNNRMQLDLRAAVQRHINLGFEVVSRNPIKLVRKGCPIAYVEQRGCLVETREVRNA